MPDRKLNYNVVDTWNDWNSAWKSSSFNSPLDLASNEIAFRIVLKYKENSTPAAVSEKYRFPSLGSTSSDRKKTNNFFSSSFTWRFEGLHLRKFYAPRLFELLLLSNSTKNKELLVPAPKFISNERTKKSHTQHLSPWPFLKDIQETWHRYSLAKLFVPNFLIPPSSLFQLPLWNISRNSHTETSKFVIFCEFNFCNQNIDTENKHYPWNFIFESCLSVYKIIRLFKTDNIFLINTLLI